MNSGSGQRLSMEELKQRNLPPANPSQRDWDELLTALSALYRLESMNSDRLEQLETDIGAQAALCREISTRAGKCPALEKVGALTREVAQMKAILKQAGKWGELSVSPPSLRTALSMLIWLALILLGTMVGMVVLQAIWSGLAALWSAVRTLIP